MAIPPSPYGEYPPTPQQGGGYYHPQYGDPQYGPGYGGQPPQSTNGMAIASLVCAFLFAPLGIVFGHISLMQIKRTGEEGHGLAVAGLVLSYLITVFGVIAIVVSIVWATLLFRDVTGTLRDWGHGSSNVTAYPTATLPAFKPPATLGGNCQYPATTEPSSKPVTPPRSGALPTTPASIAATIVTNDGAIGIQLDNAKAPCTVNNFTSLGQQGYFNGTPCHRLTTSEDLGVLQCGDPTGAGSGGPGYRFPNEYPTNQYRITDPALTQPVLYPRGTLAMANAGSGTNGSQFFLVYQDSQLPPTYTVFGTIDQTGLATVDKIAAGGVQDGSDDGKPVTTATIQTVTLP